MVDRVLELKNITKKRGKNVILKDINFSINRGEVCGFVGKNGAGKSTTIKIITGMLFSDKGETIVCGKNLKSNTQEALKNVGAVVENPEMYGYMTGRQNLKYIASVLENVTKDDIENVIRSSGLGSKIDEKVKTYSLGMKQRLGLAQALMGNISLLILDEPTNGLDPIGVVELNTTINTLVKEKSLSIFISSHILSEIESICTKVIFIDDGKIVSVQKLNSRANKVTNMVIKTNSPKETSKIIAKVDGVILLKILNDGVIISKENDLIDNFAILNSLNAEGISINGFYEMEESLEDKFIKIIGGENK